MLRPYQIEAIDSVQAALRKQRATLLVMPTGTGKTVVFAELIRQWSQQHDRTLILAHRGELLEQAREKLLKFTHLKSSDVAIEKGDRTATGLRSLPPVVVASKDSLHAKRLAKYNKDSFHRIVVDECHRGIARTYQHIYDYFSTATLLGVTATPERRDKRDIRKRFGEPCYVYEIRDAIEQGYLVPISVSMVHCDGIDLSECRVTAGDLNEADLEKVMTAEAALHQIAVPTIELSESRQTLVCCVNVKHVHDLAEVMNRYKPGSARGIDGTTPDDERQRLYKQYRAGKFQYLLHCNLLAEGYDEPGISCVAMARPTTSKVVYCQNIGRGTRILGQHYSESVENGKSDLLVLDFVGNSGKHNLICGLDALDSGEDDEVRAAALRKVRAGGATDVLTALHEAEAEVAAARQAAITANVNYSIQKMSAMSVLGIAPRAGRWGGASMTEGQRDVLLRHGFKEKDCELLDKGQAAEVIDAIVDRSRNGLASVRQQKVLMRYGFREPVDRETASKFISAIVAMDWPKRHEVPSEVMGIVTKALRQREQQQIDNFYSVDDMW